MNGKRIVTAAALAVGLVVAAGGCGSSTKTSLPEPTAVGTPATATATAAPVLGSSTSPAAASSAPATPSAAATVLPSLPKVVLPAGAIIPAKLPPAAAAVVAAVAAGPNRRFDVNYLATIDQAARTGDTAALDRLIGCVASGGCAADDKLWAQAGVLDQIPLLLEKATLGQDSGDVYVPQFTGPGMFAPDQDAAEKQLLGVAFPSEYRGLVLGFQAGGLIDSHLDVFWGLARLQPAPSSTVRLAGFTTVTAADMPKADPAILARVQATTDDGKPLTVPANLVALVLEAAQDHDIDALVKLCGPCGQDPAYRARFIAAMAKSVIPYSSGRFDELAPVLETHPAPAKSGNGLFYPDFDQTWISPAPAADAADRTAHGFGIGALGAGFVDVQTGFGASAGGPVAWLGLTNLS